MLRVFLTIVLPLLLPTALYLLWVSTFGAEEGGRPVLRKDGARKVRARRVFR